MTRLVPIAHAARHQLGKPLGAAALLCGLLFSGFAHAAGGLDEPCRVGVNPACNSDYYCEGNRCRVRGGAGNWCRQFEPRCGPGLQCMTDNRCRDTCQSDADCADVSFCNGRELCRPGTPGAVNGCVAATSQPCQGLGVCEEDAALCSSGGYDEDGDGRDSIATGGDDCDDLNSNRFPGNVETCDALDVDEDCDPTTYGDRDSDQDGFVDDQCVNR